MPQPSLICVGKNAELQWFETPPLNSDVRASVPCIGTLGSNDRKSELWPRVAAFSNYS